MLIIICGKFINVANNHGNCVSLVTRMVTLNLTRSFYFGSLARLLIARIINQQFDFLLLPVVDVRVTIVD